jgi:hypothetical protein
VATLCETPAKPRLPPGRCDRIRRFKQVMQSLPRAQRALEISVDYQASDLSMAPTPQARGLQVPLPQSKPVSFPDISVPKANSHPSCPLMQWTHFQANTESIFWQSMCYYPRV